LKDDDVEASFEVGDLTNASDHLNVCGNFLKSDADCISDEEEEGERKQTQSITGFVLICVLFFQRLCRFMCIVGMKV